VSRISACAVVGPVEAIDRVARLLLLTVLILVASFQAAFAASDTALRAMYCVPVIVATIETQRNAFQELLKSATPNQRKEFTDSASQLERDLVSNRQRLAAYVASNGLLGMIDKSRSGHRISDSDAPWRN
jgi:hypothetical protein